MIEILLSCRGVLADSIFHLSAKPDRLALRILLGSADHHPAESDCRALISLQDLDLGKVYLGTMEGEQCFHPCSMVCYYGRHYHAFVRKDGQWLSFDDATSNVVGSWSDIVRKCEIGKIQPAVLLFEAASG